jgi:hypothetical protein
MSEEQAQLQLPGLPERDDPYAHWVDMPMFEQNDLMPIKQVIVSMMTEEDVIAFAELIGQRLTLRGKSSVWYPASSHRTTYERLSAE